MKFSETKTKWVAIALFYMIAVVTRAVVLKYQVITIYIVIVATWFIIWYVPWNKFITCHTRHVDGSAAES